MGIVITAALATLAVSLFVAYFKFLHRTLRPGEPPIAPGHWLWGNCIQFKEHAVKFLLKARAQCGDVFTVRFLNQHITMVLDVHSYERFAKQRSFDFDKIAEQVNRNVFQYELVNARKMISEAGQKVNGRHLFTSMENFASNLKDAFREMESGESDTQALGTTASTNSSTSNTSTQAHHRKLEKDLNEINSSMSTNNSKTTTSKDILASSPSSSFSSSSQNHQHQLEHPQIPLNPSTAFTSPSTTPSDKPHSFWHEDDLRNFASRTFFSPLFYTIFGHGARDSETSFHPQVFHKKFDQFHKYFNFLWLGVPAQLFPEAMKAGAVLAQQPSSADMMAREGCSEYIKFSTDFMLRHSQSESDIVGHNLVFLHVNYNTFRVVYWCMYKLMEDAKIMAALREEVEEAVEAKRSGCTTEESVAEFTTDDIHKLPLLESFLQEVIRMMSGVFMIRKVVEDTAFTTDSGATYNIRKGDRVAIYPPAFHYDPEIYEEPETFKYDRFVDSTFYKNGKAIKHPVIGFGSLCPGQKFAVLQIKWFIINLLNSFKIELLDGERTEPNINMYGHEILPPTHDVRCRFLSKDAPVTLTYVNNYGLNKVPRS